MSMFCYQCEQTAKGSGCTQGGVCGKKESTAKLQDLILFLTKGLGLYYNELLKKGVKNEKINHTILDALFTTVTNVNFDDERLKKILIEIAEQKKIAKELCKENNIEIEEYCICGDLCQCGDNCECDFDIDKMIKNAEDISIAKRKETQDPDKVALEELLTYGLKGTAAYAHHAWILGCEDDSVYEFFADALALLARNEAKIDELLAYNLKCGEINLKVMELLDIANTQSYGHPEPTKVRVTPLKGKAILVSGHDLKDLEELLKQTEGLGINVYTHGEMLPCNAYPELKKYIHLVGNYGGAWQDQQKEFKEFPGTILMTTNCIQNPKGYEDRIYTSGLVAYEGVKHIPDRNFSELIDKALLMEGFTESGEEKYIKIGFGHNAIISVSEQLLSAVKTGKIRHLFLVGGCDGAKTGRNYYTELAQKIPKDCIIMTLACGKYRFNKLEFGEIEGIPRLLDIGQCNDAYSAIKVAGVLAKVFDTDVNGLPLSIILSWYEQKAVCILLSLLYLGIKNIRLGPSLPAFITPNILNVLVDKFAIKPITTADEDLKAILG